MAADAAGDDRPGRPEVRSAGRRGLHRRFPENWRLIGAPSDLRLDAPPPREGSLMFETAVIGLGTMGPGIAARLARGGVRGARLRHIARRHGTGAGADRAGDGRPRQARRRRGAGRRKRRDLLQRSRRRGPRRDARHRERPREDRDQGRGLPGPRRPGSRRHDRRLRHVGNSDHEIAGLHVASRAGGRHALVEPASHHSDDRGDRGPAHEPGDRSSSSSTPSEASTCCRWW